MRGSGAARHTARMPVTLEARATRVRPWPAQSVAARAAAVWTVHHPARSGCSAAWLGRARSRVMMITAPAGYGKTTLLAQWAEADPRPFAWLQLERDDDDPVRLARDVAFALVAYRPEVDPAIFDALRGDTAALESVALPRLGTGDEGDAPVRPGARRRPRAAHRAGSGCAADRHQHLPEHSLLVVAGRSQPAIPLARLRASGLLDEIDSRELALTRGESQQLLAAAVPGISPALAASVAERCEGWAAALYLASIALRHDRDHSRCGADLTIADYLNEEVLARPSDDDRSFLTRSSILDRLTAIALRRRARA